MIARPMRKSRELTQPGDTVYSRRRTMRAVPPPNVVVPARYKLANRENNKDVFGNMARITMTTMKVTKKSAMIEVPTF